MRTIALRRPSHPRTPSAALTTALLLMLTTLFVLLPATRAAAHDQLIGSDPASDSRVEALPDEIALTFSAAVIDSPEGTAVVVADASGRVVSSGDAEIDGAIVRQHLDTAGSAAGVYTVQWTVVSSDGHPTDGEFSFTVDGAEPGTPSPAETESSDAAADTPSADPATPSEAPATPITDEPDMESGFSLSVPWIIGIAVVVLILIALLIVMVSRRRGPQYPDSDASSER